MTEVITIDVYPSDTEYTIQQRVAAKLNSTPNYISVDLDLRQIRSEKTATIEVVNLLRILKDRRDKNFKFYKNTDVYNAIKKKVGKNFSLLEDVIAPFIYFRVSDDEEFAQTEYIDYAQHAIKSIETLGETAPEIDISNVSQKKAEFLSKLEAAIDENKKAVAKFVEGYKKLESMVGKPYTDFELERVEIQLTMNFKNMDIMSVFNRIILTKDVPFASLNDYYKILKGTVPPLIKAKEMGKITLLVGAPEKSEEDEKDEDIEDELTLVTILEKDEEIVMRMDLEIVNQRKKNDVIEKVLKVFPMPVQIIGETPIGVNGVFYFPTQVLDPAIFAHLLLNDVAFYKTLAINESEKSTKTKEGIYTYFNAGNEIVSSVITPKIVYSYDPTMRDKDRAVFPEGDFYVSVRISKASSVEVVKKYQETLSKIFSLYDIEYRAVLRLYKMFLDPLGLDLGRPTRGKVKSSTKVFLRKMIPELFTPRYSRSCRKQPIIINEADKTKYANALLFPKSPAEGPQRLYACDHKDDKFVGLRVNDPKSDYRFVPCCYKLDQRLDRNSWYNIYTNWTPGQDIDDECLFESDSAQQNITTTKKLARYGLFGHLTDFVDINTVFKYDSYLRRGMDRSRLSFLQCVFEANEVSYGQNGGTCKGRVGLLKKIIEDITSKPYLLNTTKQGFHNKTVDEIRDIILDKSAYFDPRYFIPLLEVYFECNIFVFTPTTLIVPEHLQNFLHLVRNAKEKTIIILEHMGTEGENITHPQCELIVRTDTPLYKSGFEDADEISGLVRTIFDDMCVSRTLDRKVMYYTPEFAGHAKIYSQIINDYGKTCGMFLEFDSEPVFLYSKTALPPLPVNNNPNEDIIITHFNVAMNFSSLPFVVERKKVVSYGEIIAIEIKTVLDNVYFIPVMFKQNFDEINLPVSDEKIFFPRTGSYLTYFNKQKRMSHYLTEYCKYLFSYFVYQGNHYDITDEVYNAFIEASFVIDTTYRYDEVPSKFGVVNEGFVRNSQIIINSNNLLIKLIYILKAEKEQILDYYQLENIKEVFNDILDFDRHPSQILLYGGSTLVKFIKEATSVHGINEKILVKPKSPYFFSNPNLDRNMYLATDVDSMVTALSYVNNWNTKGFAYSLPPISDEDEDRINISIYNFVSQNEIIPIHDARSKDKILVYKVGDKLGFVVLLGKIF
jgi:hypothetical protein